uniref:Uncharacterized protein n=1 Tax=mine drainage metagenome TaxID=410659 RepID=E6QDW7_9ZZZZ
MCRLFGKAIRKYHYCSTYMEQW